MGSIIEIYDEEVEPRVIIGHEGCDFGNVKTVRQLEIYWEEVAFNSGINKNLISLGDLD